MPDSLSILQALAKGGAGGKKPTAQVSSFQKQLAAIGHTGATPDLPGGGSAPSAGGGGIWHILGDIIDRPRRAVAQVGEALGEGVIDAAHGKLDVGREFGNLVSAVPRGLFSGAKSDQESTSDIIEELTDHAGKYDPNYRNTKDNVNPLLKGIAGFAGDVLTDPLTYVPLPVGKGIGALSKVLGHAAPEAERALSIGAEAVEKGGDAQSVIRAMFEQGGADTPDIVRQSGRGGQPLAIEAPKVTVDSAGVATRPGAAEPAPSVFEPGVPDHMVSNRLNTSKVADTDPVLLPPEHQVIQALSKPDLDAAEKAVLATLPAVIRDQFSKKGYTYALRVGAHATSLDGNGLAKFTKHLGTYSNWNSLKALAKPLQEAAKTAGPATKKYPNGSPLVGLRRATWIADQVMPQQKLAESLVDSYGGVFHIDYKGTRVPVSISDVYDIAKSQGPEAERAIKLALFNQNTAVAPTKIMEAAVMSANGADDAEILAHLASAAKGHVRTGDLPEGQHFTASGKTVTVAHVGKYSSDDMLRGLLQAIGSPASVKILEKARANQAAGEVRFGTERLQMSDEIKANLTALVSDPEQLGKALVAINRPDVAAKDIAERARTLGEVPPAATDDVVRDLDADHPGVIENAKSAESVETAGRTGGNVTRAAHIASDQGAKQAEQVTAAAVTAQIPEAVVMAADDSVNVAQALSSKAYREAQGSFWAFVDPLSKGVNEGRGLEGTGLFHVYNSFGSAKRAIADQHRGAILALVKDGSSPIVQGEKRTLLNEAFDTYLRGVRSENPQVQALRDGVADLMGQLLPTGGGPNALGSVFHRIGLVDGDGLEWLMGRVASGHYPGLKGLQLDIGVAKKLAAAEGITPFDAALRQLPDLAGAIDDVPEFLNSLSLMSLRAANEAAVSHQAQNKLIELGLASLGPKKGMLRVRFDKSSPLKAFTHPELRVDPKAAAALMSLHTMMTPKGPIQGAIGTFLREVFDPIQNGWKFGVTLPRPGHHIRNMIGNLTMNFMAEGARFSTQATRDMAKIMATRNEYTGVDTMKFLTSFGEIGYKGPGETLFRTKQGKFTAADVYGKLKDQGVMASFKDIEGFGDLAAHGADEAAEEGSKGLASLSKKLTRSNPLSRQLGKLSEFNDHTSKVQQAAQILRKYEADGHVTAAWGQKIVPKSEQELWELIGARVRTYHPDGQSLTEFERRTIRRVIPFYTWMRGALPALIETSLMHPGRATVFTKASYNLAVASGVNPDSLADPFPTDQLFPSFLHDQIQGPQLKVGGAYFSVSPGVATMDMANTFAPGPAKAAVGMLSPLLRVPFEAATGKNLTTGADIKDWSDYIDQQIPGISNVANMTGYSATGSVAGLVSGNGLDQQAQVRKGNKGEVDSMLSQLTWLTGASVQNESRPNYVKAAEYEQRDAAKPIEEGAATRF